MSKHNIMESRLADDIIYGAAALSVEIYGTASKQRRIYQLVEQGHLPVFRLGLQICARRSVLRRAIEEQEQAALNKRPAGVN